MKNRYILVLALALLAFFAPSLPAQTKPAVMTFVGRRTSDPNCGLIGTIYYNTSSIKYRVCTAVGSPGTWADLSAAGGGSGTVTNTGGNLTANSVVLGAGTVDTKVVAGVVTDGISKVTLGVSGTNVGAVAFNNATSGSVTLSPVTGALGAVTLSLPAATDTLVGKATADTLTNKTLTTPTLTTPVINGASTGTGVATAATASTLALRDANANLTVNNHIDSFATTVTAAGTTTLVVGSAFQQAFTGTSTQTVVLPVASTLVVGQKFQIVNLSTGAVTVQSSAPTTIITLPGNSSAVFTCILASGTSPASWSFQVSNIVAGITNSNGAANTVLKTDSSGFVNNATGLVNTATTQLQVNAALATDQPLAVKLAASPSGDAVDVFASDGTTKLLKVTKDGYISPATASAFNVPNFFSVGDTTTGLAMYGSGNITVMNSNNANLGIALNLTNGGSGFVYGWNSTSGAFGAANDAGLKRVSPAVFAPTDGGTTNLGWMQSAGSKRVSANVTNATATQANITDLTIPAASVAAGAKISGTFIYYANNSTAAEGLAFDFNGGTATFTSVEFGFSATPPGVTLGTITSTAIATAITATTATTADAIYTIRFTGVVNVSGTIIPRVAEVSHTTGTATLKLGSFTDLNNLP